MFSSYLQFILWYIAGAFEYKIFAWSARDNRASNAEDTRADFDLNDDDDALNNPQHTAAMRRARLNLSV